MKTHPKTIRTRRNRYLLLVMLVLIVGALIYAGYWRHYCRFRVVSHNAFITGNLIPVEADATGIVTQILVEESQYVNKGDIEAKVGGTSRILHPDVEAAKYKFIAAYLEYSRQQIHAPVSGYVSMRKVQVGSRVQPGDPLMTLVPLDHLWVEANLRETEMARIHPGQSAEITVDLYGKNHIYHGTVEGLIPGTGSVFALLPPNNAAGNFIHIVERVPVRIALRKDEILKNPIRPGLSTTTSIDVEESEQPLDASMASVSSQEYETDIFIDELADAEAKAQKIIMDNLIQKTLH